MNKKSHYERCEIKIKMKDNLDTSLIYFKLLLKKKDEIIVGPGGLGLLYTRLWIRGSWVDGFFHSVKIRIWLPSEGK